MTARCAWLPNAPSASSPELLPVTGGMPGGCRPEGCGGSWTGGPWAAWERCCAWSCCCCNETSGERGEGTASEIAGLHLEVCSHSARPAAGRIGLAGRTGGEGNDPMCSAHACPIWESSLIRGNLHHCCRFALFGFSVEISISVNTAHDAENSSALSTQQLLMLQVTPSPPPPPPGILEPWVQPCPPQLEVGMAWGKEGKQGRASLTLPRKQTEMELVVYG